MTALLSLVRAMATRSRAHRSREHLRIGQVHQPVRRVQRDLGDADLDHFPEELAAQRP